MSHTVLAMIPSYSSFDEPLECRVMRFVAASLHRPANSWINSTPFCQGIRLGRPRGFVKREKLDGGQ